MKGELWSKYDFLKKENLDTNINNFSETVKHLPYIFIEASAFVMVITNVEGFKREVEMTCVKINDDVIDIIYPEIEMDLLLDGYVDHILSGKKSVNTDWMVNNKVIEAIYQKVGYFTQDISIITNAFKED